MQLFRAIPKHVSKLSLCKARAEHLTCMLLPLLYTRGKKTTKPSTPEQVISLPCPLIKKSVPIRKRHFASLNTIKLILDWLENRYGCFKLCLLKFAMFLQYRAGKHRIILGTADTCSLSSGSIFLYLIATRCLHFTDCRTNPSTFPTP